MVFHCCRRNIPTEIAQAMKTTKGVPRVSGNDGAGAFMIVILVLVTGLSVAAIGLTIHSLTMTNMREDNRAEGDTLLRQQIDQVNNVLQTLGANVSSTCFFSLAPGVYGAGMNKAIITVDACGGISNIQESSPLVLPDPSGTYGTGMFVPVITVDEFGRVTNVSPTPIGAVMSVTAGAGLDGGTITASGTLSLEELSPNPFTNVGTSTLVPVITTDAYGRVTVVDSVPIAFPDAVTRVVAGDGLNGGIITSTGNISLPAFSATTTTYNHASVTVDVHGRVTSAVQNSPPVTSVNAGMGLVTTGSSTTPTVSINTTGVSPGSYTYSSITVNAEGQLTGASSGTDYGPQISMLQMDIDGLQNTISDINMTLTDVDGVNMTLTQIIMDVDMLKSTAGTVSSISAGTGLSGGTITTSGTIALTDTGVMAGSYTYGSITVDAQGRLTSASSNVPVTSITSTNGNIVTSASTGAIDLDLPNVGPGANTYGSGTQIPVITLDTKGRIQTATSVPVSSSSSTFFIQLGGEFPGGQTRTTETLTFGHQITPMAGCKTIILTASRSVRWSGGSGNDQWEFWLTGFGSTDRHLSPTAFDATIRHPNSIYKAEIIQWLTCPGAAYDVDFNIKRTIGSNDGWFDFGGSYSLTYLF